MVVSFPPPPHPPFHPATEDRGDQSPQTPQLRQNPGQHTSLAVNLALLFVASHKNGSLAQKQSQTPLPFPTVKSFDNFSPKNPLLTNYLC